MPILLDDHDMALVTVAHAAMRAAMAEAHCRSAVTRRIASLAVRYRNRGRKAAIKAKPFAGICEASGWPLDDRDKVLDEIDPELGYAGPLRWVCPKANNSGPRSCGGC
jgi:hypothetical protein